MASVKAALLIIRNAFLIYLVGMVVITAAAVASILSVAFKSIGSNTIPLQPISNIVHYSIVAMAVLNAAVALMAYFGFRRMMGFGRLRAVGLYGSVMWLASVPVQLLSQEFIQTYTPNPNMGAYLTLSSLPTTVKVSTVPMVAVSLVGDALYMAGMVMVLASIMWIGLIYRGLSTIVGSAMTIIGEVVAMVASVKAALMLTSINPNAQTAAIYSILPPMVVGGFLAFIGVILVIVGLEHLSRLVQ